MLQEWEKRLARKIYEARKDGRRKRGSPRKTWTEELKRAYEARGEKWENARKFAKTENDGNNYGGDIH